ncbi:hypothetical protein ZWY2020_019879 [Hordeum vulgare]|nr:hypothetical protein ZWY2020_019879 [Hordeum vulgare]
MVPPYLTTSEPHDHEHIMPENGMAPPAAPRRRKPSPSNTSSSSSDDVDGTESFGCLALPPRRYDDDGHGDCARDRGLHDVAMHSYVPLALAPADALLDGFLALANAYGSFLAALLALRGHTADLRAAVRRRDPVKLASAARAQRRAAKDLAGLAAAVARCAPVHTHATSSSSSGVEVARTVAQAVSDTAAASMSVFLQVTALADATAAMALASSSATSPKTRLTLVGAARLLVGHGLEHDLNAR